MICDASVLDNLKDAGCDEEMIERYRAIASDAPECVPELVRLLAPHRKALLDSLHADQERLECLDYLLFQLRNERR